MISLVRRILRRPPRPLGQRGERYAAKWLARRGYRILQTNVTFGDDEADLIAEDPDGRTIVVVEVKTREQAHPAPEASVGPTKQYRLSRCAARLARMSKYRDRPFRFDVIAIIWPDGSQPQVRHWPGAFESRL